MVTEYAAAAALSLVIIAMLFYCNILASAPVMSFVCLCFCLVYFLFGLSLLFLSGLFLFARARWRLTAAAECVGFRACRRPTHLMGPLVDDHLIYCNITHTRTINERRRSKGRGEKKRMES